MCYSMCAKTNYEKIKILWKKCLKQLSQRADRCRNGFGWLGACLLWGCCCGAASDGPLSAVFFDRSLACFTCSSGLHLHHQL